MTRDIYIRTKSGIRRYHLGKLGRPQTVLNRQLYRTDDALMMADRDGDTQFVMYDYDKVVPYYSTPAELEAAGALPDYTMAYNDIAKQAGTPPSKVSLGINPMWIIYGVIGIVIIYAVATGGVFSNA